MERINLFFLHGFLGRPEDWKQVQDSVGEIKNLRIFNVDYFREPSLTPDFPFDTWAQQFNAWAQSQTAPNEQNILIGYSLGGRLSLHAIKNDPALWRQAYLLSTNPGFDDAFEGDLSNSPARQDRWQNDCKWSEQFENQPWNELLKSWNNQAVFAGGKEEPLRLENEFSRKLLSKALTQWSLAHQKNLRDVIENNATKILWIVGDKDGKYKALGLDLNKRFSGLTLEVIEGASHRLMFDAPERIGEIIKKGLPNEGNPFWVA